MGLFGETPEEKQIKKEKSVAFWGKTLQPIGQIVQDALCILTLDPDNKKLVINNEKKQITLPYDRIRSFTIVDEVTLEKSGSGLGGAIAGGLLFGVAGAIVGSGLDKGKTKIKWFGALKYVDKDGKECELNFVEMAFTGFYQEKIKNPAADKFERVVNEIAARNSEDINEL